MHLGEPEVRKLRAFVQACAPALPELRRQQMVRLGLAGTAPAAVSPAGGAVMSTTFATEASDKEMKQADVANRQWEAICRVLQMLERMPHRLH